MKAMPDKQNPKLLKELEAIKLKPKTKAFVDLLDSNPKMNQTEAYLATHQTVSGDTARANASRSLATANVILYRKKHAQMAVRNIVDLARDKSVHEATRLKANIDILDRFAGKATQKVESSSVNLNVNLEASQELSADFTAFLKQKSQI